MFDNMNILDYINYLVEECGYQEEDAERCADVMFNDDWDMDD